ncbi:MAG: Crp/Fnr family transcriptional regulator [Bacteroidetes bacterium]|nr:MAG: Crp/Fnr family transcriptional regulator [Bacteroidota bacterium]
MENKLVQYFSTLATLTAEEARAIDEGANVKTVQKGTFLWRAGQTIASTYFVWEGCLREYLVVDGEEKTTNFYTENQWAIPFNSFTPQEPILHNLVCVEDTTLSMGNEEEAQHIFKQFPRFETISRAVMETVFQEQRKAMTSYLTDSPEQRYLKLLQSRPDLFQRVPQYQLASYIGVKPESLSRIRKRIMKNDVI